MIRAVGIPAGRGSADAARDKSDEQPAFASPDSPSLTVPRALLKFIVIHAARLARANLSACQLPAKHRNHTALKRHLHADMYPVEHEVFWHVNAIMPVIFTGTSAQIANAHWHHCMGSNAVTPLPAVASVFARCRLARPDGVRGN